MGWLLFPRPIICCFAKVGTSQPTYIADQAGGNVTTNEFQHEQHEAAWISKIGIYHWIGLRENLNRKPWFLPSNIGISCKISHHPILWKTYNWGTPNFQEFPVFLSLIQFWGDGTVTPLEDVNFASGRAGSLRRLWLKVWSQRFGRSYW